MSHHAFCRSCDAQVPTQRPPRALAGAGLVGVTLGMVLAVLGASLIGPFIMFAIPFMAVFGFALGPLHWLATMPETCARCGREVRSRHEGATAQRVAAPAAARRAA